MLEVNHFNAVRITLASPEPRSRFVPVLITLGTAAAALVFGRTFWLAYYGHTVDARWDRPGLRRGAGRPDRRANRRAAGR